MCTLKAPVYNESVLETSSISVDLLCVSWFRMKLKAGNKQITEALNEQIVLPTYFAFLKSFP